MTSKDLRSPTVRQVHSPWAAPQVSLSTWTGEQQARSGICILHCSCRGSTNRFTWHKYDTDVTTQTCQRMYSLLLYVSSCCAQGSSVNKWSPVQFTCPGFRYSLLGTPCMCRAGLQNVFSLSSIVINLLKVETLSYSLNQPIFTNQICSCM